MDAEDNTHKEDNGVHGGVHALIKKPLGNSVTVKVIKIG